MKHLYWDMHGLIFETSIWLLAGSTRLHVGGISAVEPKQDQLNPPERSTKIADTATHEELHLNISSPIRRMKNIGWFSIRNRKEIITLIITKIEDNDQRSLLWNIDLCWVRFVARTKCDSTIVNEAVPTQKSQNRPVAPFHNTPVGVMLERRRPGAPGTNPEQH